MPKIQAYNYENQIMPVTGAKRCTAYQCRFTGEIYKTKQKYVQALHKRRSAHLNTIRRKKRRAQIDAMISNVSSIQELCEWIDDNQDLLKQDYFDTADLTQEMRDGVGFHIDSIDVQYVTFTSGPHNSGNENEVKGYYGTVKFIVKSLDYDNPLMSIGNSYRRDDFTDYVKSLLKLQFLCGGHQSVSIITAQAYKDIHPYDMTYSEYPDCLNMSAAEYAVRIFFTDYKSLAVEVSDKILSGNDILVAKWRRL